MSDNKKPLADNETILLTLDQIGQTIDIMTNVVGRLRGYITEQMETETSREHEFNTQSPMVHKQSRTLH